MDIKKNEKRPTIGHLVNELNTTSFDVGDATDLEISNDVLSEYQDEYERKFSKAISEGKKRYPHKDFFIEIHLQVPLLLQRKLFNFTMHPRKSLPVPTFDQALWRYHVNSESFSLVWIIPDIYKCELLYRLRNNIPDGLKDNLKYVMHFKEGTLFSDTYKVYKQREVEGVKV